MIVVGVGFAVVMAVVGGVVEPVVKDWTEAGAAAVGLAEVHIAAAVAEVTEEVCVPVLADVAGVVVVNAVHMRGDRTALKVEDRQKNLYSSRIAHWHRYYIEAALGEWAPVVENRRHSEGFAASTARDIDIARFHCTVVDNSLPC